MEPTVLVRGLLRLLLFALLLYAVFAALAWSFSERLIFFPPRGEPDVSGEILHLPRAGGGTVAAVHLVNSDARYTILFAHGNAETIHDGAAFLRRMHGEGFSVLAFDYSGYGLSSGSPSERAAYADADAAYEYLTRSAGVAPERIIAHGRSLGGAVAADLASRRPVAGLVLESTFTSAFRVVRDGPLFPFDRFRTLAKLPRVQAPVLVMHGTADEVIALAHGRRLFEAARGRKEALWVDGAGHNDLAWVGGEQYWAALQEFAEGLE